MIKKNNKECLLCHERYTYCASCEPYRSNIKLYPRFMTTFCSQNCFDIFNLISEYENNKNEKRRKEVLSKLRKCDLSKREQYVEKINDEINEIFGINKTALVEHDILTTDNEEKTKVLNKSINKTNIKK